jgi:hypothetical protein
MAPNNFIRTLLISSIRRFTYTLYLEVFKKVQFITYIHMRALYIAVCVCKYKKVKLKLDFV